MEILVMGAGRGGTSLIASMLDAHPQLEVATEDYVADFLLPKGQGPLAQAEQQLAKFVKACDKAAAKSKLRYGNKVTTEQLGFVEDYGRDEQGRMALLRLLWQRRKIVFIVRDGRSCISSKLERTDNSYAQALAYWKHSIAMLRFLQEKEVDLVLIRFEDLLAQPREELRKVCDFLDLTYSESMLSGTASDRIFIDYRQQGLDAQKLQRKIDPRVKIADIEKELISLGYLSKG
jgi:hypothetical protein